MSEKAITIITRGRGRPSKKKKGREPEEELSSPTLRPKYQVEVKVVGRAEHQGGCEITVHCVVKDIRTGEERFHDGTYFLPIQHDSEEGLKAALEQRLENMLRNVKQIQPYDRIFFSF